MERYTVGVYVTYFGTKTVEANSEEEALDAVIEEDDPHGIATAVSDIDYNIQ